jgi:hypothetical protein
LTRTVIYHAKLFPLGRVYDTETNKPDPHISTAPWGWVDSPAKLAITEDEMIEVMVKKELASKIPERNELEKEYEKKTGDTPHFAAKDETLVKVLDTPNVKRKPGRPRKVA